MTKTSIVINENSIYDLRGYYQLMTPWQKRLLSQELKNALKNESTPLTDIFWMIMSQTNQWHAFSHFSLNPVIHALFQLPAAQACIAMNQYRLLTKENCYFILDAEEPELIHAAISSLLSQSILNEDSLNWVLHHRMPHYAAQLMILMHQGGISTRNAAETFASFEKCIELMGINREGILLPELDAERTLAQLYSILHTCSQLTPENIIALEKSDVFVHSDTHPNLTPQSKLYQLSIGVSLLQEANLMRQEEFNHLLLNIQSEALFRTLRLLRNGYSLKGSTENLLTASNYGQLKKSFNIERLYAGMCILDELAILTTPNFTHIAEHTEPEHLASIMELIYVYRNVHHATLNTTQYDALKKNLNLKEFYNCLKQLFSKDILTQDNINNLIDYGHLLFSNTRDQSFFKIIPDITQDHLNEIFLQCKQDRESNITDQAECFIHAEDSINKIYRLLSEKKINDERAKKAIRALDKEIQIIDTIQKIISRQPTPSFSRTLIAFHLDKTKTLSESFKKLNIQIDQCLPNERFIFSKDILDSEELFKKISASMIKFAQTKMKVQKETKGQEEEIDRPMSGVPHY